MNAHGEMSGSSDKFLGKQFLSHMEAYNFYNSFARNRGFSVRRKGTDKSRKPPHEIICRKFCCNKEGLKKLCDKRQDGLTVHRRVNTRVGCPAEMHIRLRLFSDSSRYWVITKFVDTHSHELSSPDKVHHHYSHQSHRSTISRSIMSNLVDVGMRPSNISRVVNAMSQGEGFEEVRPQQVIDFTRQCRNNCGDEFISIIKYFQEKGETDPEFFFSSEVDNAGTLRSIFWADGRAISSYLTFCDVIIFDTTYRTNHLSLPFAPFTGVNHHRQSILFGCALLADEQRDTFVWLFQKWLKCMHGVEPKLIITDQDAQIGDAIKIVFPTSRHRYCFWHVRKHIAEQQIPMANKYGEDMVSDFHAWYTSRDISTCEERWRLMSEKYQLEEEDGSWLMKMYRLRGHWVNAYLKDVFCAGMTTSQRSESINSFFDGFVNSKH